MLGWKKSANSRMEEECEWSDGRRVRTCNFFLIESPRWKRAIYCIFCIFFACCTFRANTVLLTRSTFSLESSSFVSSTSGYTAGSTPPKESEVPLCPWMTVPLEVRYPRVKSNITFRRATDCMKELNEQQANGTILWIPASGSLLQSTALGGSHGQSNDDDLDILLLTTLNKTAEQHCTNNAIGNFFFSFVQSSSSGSINKSSIAASHPAFANRCVCEFNDMRLFCRKDAYDALNRYIGPEWWFPISGGGKVTHEQALPKWGDPNHYLRRRWMNNGKGNLLALRSYDTDGDMQISLPEVINRLHVATSNRQFNMQWFNRQVRVDPCSIVNSWIHLNHSLWWFNALDEAFGGNWSVSSKSTVQYVNESLPKTALQECLEILDGVV